MKNREDYYYVIRLIMSYIVCQPSCMTLDEFLVSEQYSYKEKRAEKVES